MNSSSAKRRALPLKKLTGHLVRVAPAEWRAVKVGMKREFRSAAIRNPALTDPRRRPGFPVPVCLYMHRPNPHKLDHCMAICDDAWREELGSISAESLTLEGCESFEEFRLRWTNTRQATWNPLKRVNVFRVRPWDEEEAKDLLLEQVYPSEVFAR